MVIGRIVATNALEYYNEIEEFCKNAYAESKDDNYAPKDEGSTSSLLKHIKTGSIPMVVMVCHDSDIISLSGVQKYSDTLKEYIKSHMCKPNNFFQDYMYETQLTWSVNYGFKIALITFNEHNKRLIPVLEREQRKGRSFQSFKKLDKTLEINNKQQYVFYKKLDENYDVENITIR